MNDIEIEKGIFLTAEGIAVFTDPGIAAAADLHIGFEEAFGEELARMQTKLILNKFQRVLARFRIKKIVLNGDVKYSFGKKSRQEWIEIRYFISELSKYAKLVIIKGNHDFYLQSIVRDFNLRVMNEYQSSGIIFTHGDSEVEKEKRKSKLLVVGNEHPSIKLRDEIGASKKYPCFLYAKKEKVLVLPAVNPWASGTDILGIDEKHFFSPVLRKIKLNEMRVFPSDGEQIYDFKKVGEVRKCYFKNKKGDYVCSEKII